MAESMKERIARAMAPVSWAVFDQAFPALEGARDHHKVYRDHSLVQAAAVLDALQKPDAAMLDAGGFVTEPMPDECDVYERDVGVWTAEKVWSAMIDAAKTGA